MKLRGIAFLAAALLLFLAPAAFADERNSVGDHKVAIDQDWPTVSEHQEHHAGAYGTCTVEHACSLTYGGCWFKVYAKCQNKTSGAGDACKAC